MLARQFEKIAGAKGADIKGFDRVFQVIPGAGGGGKVKHRVDGSSDFEGTYNILIDKIEPWFAGEVCQIARAASEVVIEAGDGVSIGKQAVA